MNKENDSSQEKTHEPTEKKLRDAREKGQVPISKEVSHFFVLLAITFIMIFLAPQVSKEILKHSSYFIHNSYQISLSESIIQLLLSKTIYEFAGILMIPTFILMCFSVLGYWAQNSLVVSSQRLKPSLQKVNPFKNIKNIVSFKNLFEFGKSFTKLIIVFTVLIFILIYELPYFQDYSRLSTLEILKKLFNLSVLLCSILLCIMLIIAGVDFAYQKYEFMKKMRMSMQEVKDEMKQTEGNPEIKKRIRDIRLDRFQKLLQTVPQADVVITNPTHFAVALSYNMDTMDAPICVAKGQDFIALRIKEIAKQHHIIIYENPVIARTLFDQVQVNEAIPTHMYEAIAQVIRYVYQMKGKSLS